jgi:ribulose-phosphate 3-epimerase
MIVRPGLWIDRFASAGADILTVHAEACPHLHRDVMTIKEKGLEAGVAVNPATSIAVLDEILPEIDLALIMTVNPGFGGQRFIPRCLDKVARLRARLEESAGRARIQVDGGIDVETAPLAAGAGARELVAGSAVFGTGRPIADAVRALQAAAATGL